MDFSQLPGDLRMELRKIIEDDAGGHVAGYHGKGVRVALPRTVTAFEKIIKKAGFKRIYATPYEFFPLGSDKPPQRLRHDASYPGSKGFWRFRTYEYVLIPESRILKDNPHARKGEIDLLRLGEYGPETVGRYIFTMFAEYVLNSDGNLASYVYDSVSGKWILGMN